MTTFIADAQLRGYPPMRGSDTRIVASREELCCGLWTVGHFTMYASLAQADLARPTHDRPAYYTVHRLASGHSTALYVALHVHGGLFQGVG